VLLDFHKVLKARNERVLDRQRLRDDDTQDDGIRHISGKDTDHNEDKHQEKGEHIDPKRKPARNTEFHLIG